MSYDFYAELFVRDKEKIERKIEEFHGKKARQGEWMEQNLPRFFREKLTAKNWCTLIKEVSLFEKYYEGSNDDKKEDVKAGYKGFIRDVDVCSIDNGRNLEDWTIFKEIEEPKIDVESLSDHSIFIKVIITLKKPYISQDDENFYIIDNPVCKDKVFKVPLVRASSWKGALRWVALRIYLDNLPSNKKDAFEERSKLIRLFGNEKDKIEEFSDGIFDDGRYQPDNPERKVSDEFFDYIVARGYVNKEGNGRGRLIIYPTFLDKISLDIIAPHDRETRTVKVPIQLEVAPENAKGTFSLLYFPFDLLGKARKDVKEEVTQDMEIMRKAIPKMLTKYGFGAKTTAGYGVIKDKVEFQILPFMEKEKEDKNFGEGEKSTFYKEIENLIGKIGEKE